jgi:hypothetical protein
MPALWSATEPLWVAALALLIILPGYQFGPAIIRFFGRGGQRETVEGIVYLCVLVGLPIGVFLVARVFQRVSPKISLALKAVALVVLAAEVLFYVTRSQWHSIGAALVMSLLTVALVAWVDGGRASDPEADRGMVSWVLPVLVGVCAWMSAGSLIQWTDATRWLVATPARIAVFIAAFAISVLAMRALFRSSSQSTSRSWATKVVTLLGAILLLALGFRGNPVLEFYHWTVYVGPMQALRQGGWLLWDAPAQYGVLSILIPTLFPGNAWQSFYLFQALCNAIVAMLMFWALGGTRNSIAQIALATTLTGTTLFFRPRAEHLLIAGQMTPSGGPVRFIWLFVMLAFVFRYYSKTKNLTARDVRDDSRFEIWGHFIWVASVCWSFESGIYCSAVWFPAYVLLLTRRSSRELQSGSTGTEVTRGILRSIALPIGGLLLIIGAVSVFYRLVQGHSPDWMGYFEYALLYGGGFRTLPIDPSGEIWFLLIIFLAVSTAAVFYLLRDPGHPRVMVLAGAWGGIWAISSYFVSRSHFANLLSIATFVIFAAALTLRVIADQPPESWHGLLRVAIVPMFVTPIVLTVGHSSFVREITTPQLSYGSFTEQIPLMEPSLNELLLEAGAKPADPVVRIGDARLMLPAWRPKEPGGPRRVSPYSWLPKQFEIIGTLAAERRRKYIDRLAAHLRLSGWLVHSKTGGIKDFQTQLADIQRTHVETKRFENNEWIVSWYQLKQ